MRKARLAAVIMLATSAASIAAGPGDPNPKVTVDKKTGLISIEAREARLSQVMKAFEERTGIQVRMDDEAESTISANIEKAGPVEALKLLGETTGISYAVLYKPQPQGQKPVPYAVRIIPAGRSGGAAQYRPPYTPPAPPSPPMERSVPTSPSPPAYSGETSHTMSEAERERAKEIIEERKKAREEREKTRAQRRQNRERDAD